MEVTGGLVYTKALWTVISGTHLRATCEVVKYELDRAEEMISKGLTSYNSPNEEADKKLKKKVTNQVYKFVFELSTFLGLESLQSWDLLSNYLVYEFQGSEVGLQAFLESDEKKAMLMTDIWMFYHSERLFLLKCINLVLAYSRDNDHPYQETLKEFLARFDQEDFAALLEQQLEKVTNEPYPHRDIHGVLMTDKYQLRWQNYNLREQIEVLHNIILHVEMHGVKQKHLEKIVQICIDCRFGKQEEYKLRNTVLATHYSQMIGFLQNIIILQYTNDISGSVIESGTLEIDLDDFIRVLGNQEEHAVVMLSWTLIRVFETKDDPSSDALEKLEYLAVNSRAFKYLQKLVSCDMFQLDSRLSGIMFRTVYKFLSLFANYFEIQALSGIPELLNLLGPLLRHKDIVEIFWNEDNEIKPLFWALADRFPAEYSPFMNVVNSLAACGEYIEELMDILVNMKSFAENVSNTELAEDAKRTFDEWELHTERKPLASSNFVIPVGTKGRYIDGSTTLISWRCNFNVFEVIYDKLRQFVCQMGLGVTAPVNENDLKNVEISLEFLKRLLSTGVDLAKEMEGVVNYVFTLLTMLKTVPSCPTAIFALCLDITIVLLPKYPYEILKHLRIVDILPVLHSVPTNVIDIFVGEYFSPKTIGIIIAREECILGKYPLLTSYLTFIFKIIKGGSSMCPYDHYVHIVFPGIIFILGDVYPNYESWHFVEEKEHDIVAITCVKIFHEALCVSGSDTDHDIVRAAHQVRKLVLYSLLNMKTGKVLLKIVATGTAFLQMKMEKKLNWVSEEGTNLIYLLQLSLSVLNRVLLLKPNLQEKSILSALESEIYCCPKERLHVIPTVASYINNNLSSLLPVLAVKVLRRFALDVPKTLLACLGMEGDVLREYIFRRLNSKIDSNRLKVALLELVAACVDTQPGMCDALFNLPREPENEEPSDGDKSSDKKTSEKPELLRKEPVKDNTKGGILLYVCAVVAEVQKNPELVTTSLYGAVIEVACSLWLGENMAAVEYLRSREDFWNKFCAPLFSKPGEYAYAYTQVLCIITLELFQNGKNCHPDLLKNMENFFDENNSHFTDWAEFVSKMFSDVEKDSSHDCSETLQKLADLAWKLIEEPAERKLFHSQTMERQPPNVQLLISWKRFFIVAMKVLPFKISTEQKVFLTTSIMNALQHEIPAMSLKPILLLVEMYIILISEWHKHFFDNQEVVKDQIQLMLKSVAATYQLLPIRVREAVLTLANQAVDCLANQIQGDEVAAETMLEATTEIVIYELSEMGLPEHQTKLAEGIDSETGDIIQSLMHLLMPTICLGNESSQTRGSLSGRLSLLLLHKLLKILIRNTLWLKEFKIADIRNAILVGLGRTLEQIHNSSPMNMYHFNVALCGMNLIFFMTENKIADSALDYQLPGNLWYQLMPPKEKGTHWLSTSWPLLYKVSLEIITQHLQSREFIFLDSAIAFISAHALVIVDSILSFRRSMDENMLEFSMIALNLVRTLSFYPNHWRLIHEASLNIVMNGVMTCLHTCVAILINPVLLRALLEKPEKKVEQKSLLGMTEGEPSPEIITVHNQILKLTYLCLSIIQAYCPHLSYLLNECMLTPMTSRPILEPNLDSPVFDYDMLVPLTFGTMITLAHLCTQALSKGFRVPSPRPNLGNYRAGHGVGTSLMLAMDKNMTGAVFEITVEMITSQGLVYLLTNILSGTDKELFRRNLNTEMMFFIEFSKRSLRESFDSRRLDSTLVKLKARLSKIVKLPVVKNASSDKGQPQQIGGRKLIIRDSSVTRSSPTKSSLNSPVKQYISTPKGPAPSTSGHKESVQEKSSSEGSFDYHLPLSQDFVKFVAIVFSTIFDIFTE